MLATTVNLFQTFPSKTNNVSKSPSDISAPYHVAEAMSLLSESEKL